MRPPTLRALFKAQDYATYPVGMGYPGSQRHSMSFDFSLTRNLAAEQPAKLKQVQALFMKEAQKCNVLPIDDRTIERMNRTLAGRPDILSDRTSLTLYEGMQGMMGNTFMDVKNRSSKITAELDIPSGGANGAILSQGADASAAGPCT